MRATWQIHLVVACALALTLLGCERTAEPRAGDGSGSQPASPATRTTTTRPEDLVTDDRLAHLMGGCARSEPFLADTSDPIPVLVAQISEGQMDPARAAREELAVYGERALPALRRVYEECYTSQYLAPRVQNVLEVLGRMNTDAPRDLIQRGLAHPQESVRKAAARALVTHARPEDYERVLDALALAGADSRNDLALALIAADRPRLERELVSWIEADGPEALLDALVPTLCSTREREVIDAWRAVLPRTHGKVRVFLQAAVAKALDEAVLADLREMLWDPTKPVQRQLVAQALSAVGLVGELAPILTKRDPDAGLRKVVVEALASAPVEPVTQSALQSALADDTPEIRGIALAALAAFGEPNALDMAVEWLRGSRLEFDAALLALRAPMQHDPALARRVFDTLVAVQRGELGPGYLDDRQVVRAIGQIPLSEAADYVMDLGTRADGTIQGQRAFRWYAQAAGNSGSLGLARLRERWQHESDPARRMDLVMAGSFEKSDATRAFLIEALESPRSTPCEVLYAADRLARIGPSEFVAPILKRAALKVNDRQVRPAFNCLLWTWYGAGQPSAGR